MHEAHTSDVGLEEPTKCQALLQFARQHSSSSTGKMLAEELDVEEKKREYCNKVLSEEASANDEAKFNCSSLIKSRRTLEVDLVKVERVLNAEAAREEPMQSASSKQDVDATRSHTSKPEVSSDARHRQEPIQSTSTKQDIDKSGVHTSKPIIQDDGSFRKDFMDPKAQTVGSTKVDDQSNQKQDETWEEDFARDENRGKPDNLEAELYKKKRKQQPLPYSTTKPIDPTVHAGTSVCLFDVFVYGSVFVLGAVSVGWCLWSMVHGE